MSVMRVFKSELYKMKTSKMLLVCSLICIAVALFFGGIFYLVMRVTGDPERLANLIAVELFTETLKMPWLPIIIAVFVSLFVSSEFHNKTFRNYVSRGINRTEIYIAKLVVCSIATVTMILVYAAASIILGIIIRGFGSSVMAAFSSMPLLLSSVSLLMIAFTAVCALVAMCLRSNGASIAVNIIIVILLSPILAIIDFIAGWNITLSDFWIMGVLGTIATTTPADGAVARSVITGLCYIAISTATGCIVFKHKDIR